MYTNCKTIISPENPPRYTVLCDTHMTPPDDGIEPQGGAAAEKSEQRQQKVVLREGGRVVVHWRVVPVS